MTILINDAKQFRAWLKKHHSQARDVKLVFNVRPMNGAATLTLAQAQDEALCFGWCAASRKTIDANTFAVRFAPRKPNAAWTQQEIDRFAALEAEGRATPSGQYSFAARKKSKLVKSAPTAAYIGKKPPLPDPMLAELKRHRDAWAAFQRMPPSHRDKWTSWVATAKHEETRARRFDRLLFDLTRTK